MKTIQLTFFLFISLIFFSINSYAQPFKLSQTNESGIYRNNERYTIKAVREGGNDDSLKIKVQKNNEVIYVLDKRASDSIAYKAWKNNSQLIFDFTIREFADKAELLTGKLDEPGSVLLEATLNGYKQSIGLIVDPEKIKTGTPLPKDFEAFWIKEKKTLQDLAMKAQLKKVDTNEKGVECFDAELNCTGPKPARGYFAKPIDAKPKSLPIVLLVHAAGVKGSWCRSEVRNAVRYARMGKGSICFDLNAHGMLNGQPDEYYSQLEEGELKDYSTRGLESIDDIYFRGMYQRLIRTLQFLEQQPEWDGKRILVIGESQGGGQALAAAGLDSNVSAVVANVPAMCDWGGSLVGRKGGWPNPFDKEGDKEKMKKVLPYFDTANLLKYSKAILVVEIGLIDQTCPSTSVYAAINEAKGEKIIYPVPYREHHGPDETNPNYAEWYKTVASPRNAFIENYLK